MSYSPIAQFIEKLQTDDDLKQRVQEAEQVAVRHIERHTDAITQVAADAGYDITGWNDRPTKLTPSELEFGDTCTVSCCIAFTSTLSG